jgi:cell division protein FtsB
MEINLEKYEAMEREYHRVIFNEEKLTRQVFRLTAENNALKEQIKDLKTINDK